MSSLKQLRPQALARWQSLSPRERRSVLIFGVLVFILLFWAIALAPALHTLRDSQGRRVRIEQQQTQMQALQTQAQALQARLPLSRDVAWRTLRGLSTDPSIQLSAQGERVTVQLKAVTATGLATWLEQARSKAQSLPVEAHLVRTGDAQAPMWDGSLVLSLPNNRSTD